MQLAAAGVEYLDSPIAVTIKLAWNPIESLHVLIRPRDTVGQLQSRLFEALPEEPCQELCFEGSILTDSTKSLGELGVAHNNVIELKRRCTPGFDPIGG